MSRQSNLNVKKTYGFAAPCRQVDNIRSLGQPGAGDALDRFSAITEEAVKRVTWTAHTALVRTVLTRLADESAYQQQATRTRMTTAYGLHHRPRGCVANACTGNRLNPAAVLLHCAYCSGSRLASQLFVLVEKHPALRLPRSRRNTALRRPICLRIMYRLPSIEPWVQPELAVYQRFFQ